MVERGLIAISYGKMPAPFFTGLFNVNHNIFSCVGWIDRGSQTKKYSNVNFVPNLKRAHMKSIKFNGEELYPSKIVCIGRNYVDHIKELNNEISHQPVIFIKPNSAISSQIYSSQTDVIHYESEIAFLVIAGELTAVGFGLDLTKRELQSELKSKGLPWERAKAFDQSAVFSEFVSFNGNVNELRLEFYINDKLVQQAGCELMLNKPDVLLAEAKTFLSFEDGDVLMTGTPKGVGPVKSGDIYRGRVLEVDKPIVEASWVVE